MAFDNSLGDAAPPIGIFSETVEGTPVLTPGNYLDCLNGVKVEVSKISFIFEFYFFTLGAFQIIDQRMQRHIRITPLK